MYLWISGFGDKGEQRKANRQHIIYWGLLTSSIHVFWNNTKLPYFIIFNVTKRHLFYDFHQKYSLFHFCAETINYFSLFHIAFYYFNISHDKISKKK